MNVYQKEQQQLQQRQKKKLNCWKYIFLIKILPSCKRAEEREIKIVLLKKKTQTAQHGVGFMQEILFG